MKKCNSKKLYDFLIDKHTKNAIIALIAFIMLLVFNIFISNLFLRLVFYFGFYMVTKNFYDKIVNFFFVEYIKNAEN